MESALHIDEGNIFLREVTDGKTLRYDEDEILFLSGGLADIIVDDLAPTYNLDAYEDERDAVRNVAADAAEQVMKGWTGRAEIPLPDALLWQMTYKAQEAAIERIGKIIR